MRRTALLGSCLAVEFTHDVATSRIDAAWTPSIPDRLTAKQWQRYRAARDAFIKELAMERGIAVVLVEI